MFNLFHKSNCPNVAVPFLLTDEITQPCLFNGDERTCCKWCIVAASSSLSSWYWLWNGGLVSLKKAEGVLLSLFCSRTVCRRRLETVERSHSLNQQNQIQDGQDEQPCAATSWWLIEKWFTVITQKYRKGSFFYGKGAERVQMVGKFG